MKHEGWQGINPKTMKPGKQAETHVPFPKKGSLMYGLPSDFDPQIFVGRELETITYGVNVIVLVFDDRLTVSISGSLSYSVADGADIAVDRVPVSHTSLVRLAGRRVEKFDLRSPQELVLRFEGGGHVTLLDDSELYECYLINNGDDEIVV